MSITHPFPETTLIDSLRVLKDVYVDAVNRAVAEGRDDVVDELAAAYTDEAAALLGQALPAAA